MDVQWEAGSQNCKDDLIAAVSWIYTPGCHLSGQGLLVAERCSMLNIEQQIYFDHATSETT